MVRTHRHGAAAAQPGARRGGRIPTDAELPASFVAAARTSPAAVQRGEMVAAQRAAGNQALRDLLAPPAGRDEVTIGAHSASFNLRAEIPFGDGTAPPETAARTGTAEAVSSDSVTGTGQTVEITEEEPGSVQLAMSDAINGSLTFSTAVSRGNPALGADDYGLTTWSAKLVNPAVTPDPAKKVFTVTGKVDCPIGWEIHSRGKKDVLDEKSPNIKRSTWPTAASDLTPDMSDDNGRPPRTQFWAPDLTERHEKFHAGEFQTYGKAAFDLAGEWLQKQTASSDADALTVAKRVPNEMVATIRATYVPMAESRAYGDGAPSYQARAEAITKAGKADSYPA
jgi:hypothetical protein